VHLLKLIFKFLSLIETRKTRNINKKENDKAVNGPIP
jgi:hypothetical protein